MNVIPIMVVVVLLVEILLVVITVSVILDISFRVMVELVKVSPHLSVIYNNVY